MPGDLHVGRTSRENGFTVSRNATSLRHPHMHPTLHDMDPRPAHSRLAAFLLLIAAGCGTREPDRPLTAVTVVVDTVDGVEHVRSAGEAPRWTLEPVLRLGSGGGMEAPAPDEFAWVSSVALGPDGLLYVSDMQGRRIVAFDTTGALRATIGRSGRGPGEFGEVFSIAWMGDTLLAFDPANGRVGLFSRTGAWIGSWFATGARLSASPAMVRLYQVGPHEVYEWMYRAGADGLDAIWRRHTSAGASDEWLQFGPRPPASIMGKIVCNLRSTYWWFDHPYAPRGFEHPAPGNRAWVATSDAYRIALRDSAGDTVRVVERTVEPPPLPDDEWARTADRFARWIETKGAARCDARSVERPRSKPYFESLMVDLQGRLWVERNLERGTRWEIFDDAGWLVGAVDGFGHYREGTVPWLGAAHVAWVSRDSLEVPHVHLARLRTGTR